MYSSTHACILVLLTFLSIVFPSRSPAPRSRTIFAGRCHFRSSHSSPKNERTFKTNKPGPSNAVDLFRVRLSRSFAISKDASEGTAQRGCAYTGHTHWTSSSTRRSECICYKNNNCRKH